VKLSELNDATPLFEVVASSPAIVIMFPTIDVSIPSPPVICKEPPNEIDEDVDVSSKIENELLTKDAFPMFCNVFEEPLIVLLVTVFVLSVDSTSLPPNVAVVASKFATKVPVVIVKLPVDAPVAVVVPTINLSALSSNPINALSDRLVQ
jgi:hypothetical protein